MNTELQHIARRIAQATAPTGVFGEMSSNAEEALLALTARYRALAKATHPDMYANPEDKDVAQAAFCELSEWFHKAEQQIKAGNYGSQPHLTLQVKGRRYEIDDSFTQDRVFNSYPCRYVEDSSEHHALIRIVRDPRNNHLAANEVRILNILLNSRDAGKFSPYLPALLDAFLYQDRTAERQAAVFERTDGWYSLEQVHRAYPNGVDPRDMAWMWRRLLVALGFAHSNLVIHGAVLPQNIWIEPEQHGLLVANWFAAVYDPSTTGQVIPPVEPGFRSWYPGEVLNSAVPTFGTDISMSAKCMIDLLGGDIGSPAIPHAMQQFLKGSMLPGRRAPQDAWAVKQEFDDLLEALWGERTFHPFRMVLTH